MQASEAAKLYRQGRVKEGLAKMQETVAWLEEEGLEETQLYFETVKNTGAMLGQTGQFKQAENVLRGALEQMAEIPAFGKTHLLYLRAASDLAVLLGDQKGRRQAALELFDEIQALYDKLPPKEAEKFEYQTFLGNKALAMRDAGKGAEAEALLREPIMQYDAQPPRGKTQIADYAKALSNMARLLNDDKRPGEAEPYLEQAVELLEPRKKKFDDAYRNALAGLGEVRYGQGKFREAADAYAEIQDAAAKDGELANDFVDALYKRLRALGKAGEKEEAAAVAERAMRSRQAVFNQISETYAQAYAAVCARAASRARQEDFFALYAATHAAPEKLPPETKLKRMVR